MSQSPTPTNPIEIMERMVATYRVAATYVDRGVVEVATISNGDRNSTMKHFTTAFVRPDNFRFEFRIDNDPQRAYVVWSDGNQTLTSWYVEPGVVDADVLGRAIAGATGVSSGAAVIVPNMLIPDVVEAQSIFELEDMRLVGNEVVEGTACWRIRGFNAMGERDVWIDQHTHLLRKMFARRPFPAEGELAAFDTEHTTVINPVANEPVSSDLLLAPQ
jgi:hypothetical protein